MTVPNYAQAAFAVQAELDSADLEILAAAHAGTGVVSGCAVSAQGTPNMTVAVASGTVLVAGVSVSVSSGNVTITAAGVLARFDLIVVNSSGVKSAVAGTAAAQPVFPAIPASSVVLAAVYVPGGDTAIGATQIVDKRVMLLGNPATQAELDAAIAAEVARADGTYVALAGIKHVDVYGAVGDGTTDDTAAILAAATAAGDGGVVLFGAKTYAHTGLSFDQNGLTLLGMGRGKTRLQSKAGTTAAAVKLNTSSSFKQPFTIADLDIFGVSGSSHGLWIRYASVVNITNVRCWNHGGDGFRLYEVTAYTLDGCEGRDNAGNGITLGKKADAGVILGGSYYSNDGWGALVGADTAEEAGGNGRVNGVSFIGPTFIQNTSGGAKVRYASSLGVGFEGCYFEANGTGQNAQVGESGGSQVGPVDFTRCYFNGSSTVPIGIKCYDAMAVRFARCFFEGHTTGGVKLNNDIPWIWDQCVCGTGTYALQNSSSVNLSVGAASTGRRITNALKIGLTDDTATADLNLQRNDTWNAQQIRVVQSGAGTANTALVAIQADGTSTTSYALFARSKGTGSIAKFASNTATVLDILGSGRLQLNAGPQIITGTGTPEGAITAGVGSLYLRGDGGAATTLYVKESGAGNTGWVAK